MDASRFGNHAAVNVPPAGGGEEYEGPLDLLPEADWIVAYSAARALSVNMLGEVACQIRRDSDDTTQNFNYDATTGEVSAADIETFIGANLNKTGAIEEEFDTIELTDATGVEEWQLVSGQGIPAGAFVTSVDGNIVTISETLTETNPSVAITISRRGYLSRLSDNVGSNHVVKATANEQMLWLDDDFPAAKRTPSGSLSTSGELVFPDGAYTVFIVSKREAGIGVTGSIPESSAMTMSSGPSAFLSAYDGTNVAEGNFANGESETEVIVWDGSWEAGFRNLKANGVNVAGSDGDFGGPIASITGSLTISVGTGPSAFFAFLMCSGIMSDADRLTIRQKLATAYGITL